MIFTSLLKYKIRYLFIPCFILLLHFAPINAQSAWPSVTWKSAVNLTATMDANGLTEISGLHWNPVLNRLYVVHGDGRVHILQLNTSTNTFTQIGDLSGLGGPEGITQVDYNANNFYTADENSYEIRKFTHNANFTSDTLANSWNLLLSPSPMTDTGNKGNEGIAFVPDQFLSDVGFISQATEKTYKSVRGMGGLIFIANQTGGYIWVFDVNPTVSNNFAYVGKYKSNREESCDLEFDRSTGLLYILHNIDDNYLEVTNLASTIVSGERKFIVKNEYLIPNPSGNTNIEGFAISPKCADSTHVSAWLCRDVESSESSSYKKDCVRWFNPYKADGICGLRTETNTTNKVVNQLIVSPNPATNIVNISFSGFENEYILLKIYNSNGQIVFTKTNLDKNRQTINISQFSHGLYFVELSHNGQKLSQKFVVK